MNRPATIAEVEQILGINFETIKEGFKQLPVGELDQANMFYQYRWEKIIEALNKGWKPDWLDSDQYKYHPYAILEKDETAPSGFGFSCTDCGSWSARTSVGSRLLLQNKDVALYAIRNFPDEYLAMHLFATEGLK